MLKIENLSVALDGVPVLDAVSASVDAGGWLGVVGPNGAGKTTLLRAVAGLIAYDGEIRIAGRSSKVASRRDAARLVAYVPQRPVLPLAMTVTDYVLLGRSAHHSFLGAETTRDRRVVATVLDRLDLGGLARRPLGHVSGGEAQRAVLARALAQEAPILVMDEPTVSLDLGHGQLVLELTDVLRREHDLSVICALHDLTIAGQYADELLVLCDGRAVATGPPHQVLTGALVRDVFGATVEILDGRDGVVVAPARPGRAHEPAVRRSSAGMTEGMAQ
jgi:iron complex transport system ATP-binding protein